MTENLYVNIRTKIITLVVKRRIVILHIVDGKQSVLVIERS